MPKNSQAGLTLIELMVVVAIIGVMASLASTKYSKFVGRARQTEAKLSLSGIYAVEKVFYAENSTYSSCLAQLGYIPDGQRRYYATGFSSARATVTACGADGTTSCATYDFNLGTACTSGNASGGDALDTTDIGYAANRKMNGGSAYGTSTLSSSNITTDTFTAAATGIISESSTAVFDIWTMTQVKALRNTQVGY